MWLIFVITFFFSDASTILISRYMCMWSYYKMLVSLVNPLMSFMNSSPLMSFMIPERKSGIYRQMLNVLKIYIVS
jgi:hypothetical protein